VSLIMASKLAYLISLNNKEKSLSKESAYQIYADLLGNWTSVGIEWYTFMKWLDNYCIISSDTLFILLYCV
jgi:hypothetical protein